MRTEIRLAGSGGQGLITAGVILAEAAGLHGGKEVSQTQSYGPEARGGASRADVIISTAKVFGRKPPLIIAEDMVAGMKPGSVIIDMAASEHGGNVAGSRVNEEVTVNGVLIVGHDNLAGRVAGHASQMYSNNVLNLITHFWDTEAKRTLDLSDPFNPDERWKPMSTLDELGGDSSIGRRLAARRLRDLL